MQGGACASRLGTSPQLPLLAQRAANTPPVALLAGVAGLAAEDVARATNAAVSNATSLALGSATELIVDTQGGSGTLVGLVGVAGTADAAEEAAGLRFVRRGRGLRDDGGGGGGRARGRGGAEGVSCAATAGADVGGGGGRRLRDDVSGRHFGGCIVGGGGGGGCERQRAQRLCFRLCSVFVKTLLFSVDNNLRIELKACE